MNLTPDVLDTVKKLNAAGYKNQLEPGKLLPDNFNIADSPNFQKMMGPIMNNIDATRLAMKDETGSIQLANIQVAYKSSHSQYLSPLFSLEKMAAVTVIVTVTVAVTDFAGQMLEAFNGFKAKLGLTFTNEFSEHTALDGHKYQVIDPEKMVKSNPSITQNIKAPGVMTTISSTQQQLPVQSFPLFPRLPVELQRRIWELCLPARIVELDLQGTDIVPTSCSLQQTSQINSRASLATRICRESRSVAFLAGATELYDDDFQRSDTPEWEAMNDIRDLWASPPTDVLHLNYYGAYDGYYHWSGNPVEFLIWLARRYHMRMSIVASLLVGFGDTEGAEYLFGFDKNFDLLAEGGGPYLTTLCVVSLHVGLESALWKDGGMLFGRLGEERVKLIKVGDKAALKAYYNLWAAGPVEDREPEQFFDLAVSRHESEWLPRVAQWRRRLLTTWMNHCWAKAEEANELGSIQDHQGVWRAPRNNEGRIIPKGDSGPFSHYMRPGPGLGGMRTRVPNEEHPWVAGGLRDMPCFEPVVMFRLCEDKCYAPKPQRTRGLGRGGLGIRGQSSRGSV
ncbi:hypothetical protein VE01_02665 [Pseudogymnoascus verrucosus]|uniref:2EXR domain-containing protein n=1 Tax=Pseudogymnoascus verrucosus TaxID=342668 RepID=A0A1B8GTM5_9PEZI|nr:uncharacterized protein VE01_02665 [Pseudogymnoascus verrucosus]OBT99194.1 hypothetical protein VE01_02665 [Pseudogymnoascus verrucosus]